MSAFLDPLTIPDGIERPRYYSRMSSTSVSRGALPHWEQDGCTAFVTFRLADSIPHPLFAQWRAEVDDWRTMHPQPWDAATVAEYDEEFSGRLEKYLDEGLGECLLSQKSPREIVERTLRHDDGRAYRLYAFVVMPNHVHVVFMPFEGVKLSKVVGTWKSVSARRIATVLGRQGAIWQQEYFDRYVRDARHFARAVRYTVRNDPRKAWTVCGL